MATVVYGRQLRTATGGGHRRGQNLAGRPSPSARSDTACHVTDTTDATRRVLRLRRDVPRRATLSSNVLGTTQ